MGNLKLVCLSLLATVLISGCQTAQQRVQSETYYDHQSCVSMEYQKGMALYLQCRQYMSDRRHVQNAQNQAQVAALIEYGTYISNCGLTGSFCD